MAKHKKPHKSMHDMYMHRYWPKKRKCIRKKQPIDYISILKNAFENAFAFMLLVISCFCIVILCMVTVLAVVFLIGAAHALILGKLYETTSVEAIGNGYFIIVSLACIISFTALVITIFKDAIIGPYKKYKRRKMEELMQAISCVHF